MAALARDYTAQLYPDDPVSVVKGDDLPGFDGALYPDPHGRKGWAIIYNNRMASKGRINFTLAHEFGHYLLHRHLEPQGIECGQQDVVRWDSGYRQIEHQANVFAANLLMPLDDFRLLINPRDRIDLDAVSGCAERYRVSLIAAILRWLEYTEKRAVLVVSRDGMIAGGVLVSYALLLPSAVRPLPISKINTLAQMVLAGAVLAAVGLRLPIGAVIQILIVLVATTTLVSGGVYLARWMRSTTRVEAR